MSSHYHQLYTPEDTAVVFIDHQPQMTFGVASINRADLINNVTLLAKASKLFQVPTIITAVETESFSGYVWPQLLDVFPGQHVIERTSMNSWDSDEFRKAIKATGRKNILLTGLWTEVCVTWPAIEMMGDGYNIYVVEDCCGATSRDAQKAALSRIQLNVLNLHLLQRFTQIGRRLVDIVLHLFVISSQRHCHRVDTVFQHIQLAEHKSFHPAVELPATDAVDGIHHIANRTGYIAH